MPLRSLRTKLLVLWIASAALLVTLTHLVTFRTALDAQFQQLRQMLMAIAATSALQIDGEAHAAIPPTASSIHLPAYHTLVQQLRAIRHANPSIRYVYTMVPSDVPGNMAISLYVHTSENGKDNEEDVELKTLIKGWQKQSEALRKSMTEMIGILSSELK